MQLSFSHFLLLAAALGFQSALGAPCRPDGICSRDVAQPVARNALPDADQLHKHHLEERQVGPMSPPSGPMDSPSAMDSSSGSPAPVLPDRRDFPPASADPYGKLVPEGGSAGNIVGSASTTQPEAMMLLANSNGNGILPQ